MNAQTTRQSRAADYPSTSARGGQGRGEHERNHRDNNAHNVQFGQLGGANASVYVAGGYALSSNRGLRNEVSLV